MQSRRLAMAVGAAFALAAPAFAADDTQRNPSSQDRTSTSARDADARASGAMAGSMQGSSAVRNAQQALQEKGHDVGPIDGIMGPKTAAAVREFQQAQGLKASGQLDRETLSALNVQSSGASDRDTRRDAMSRSGTGRGSSKGPSVSSDATSPSPSSTQSGKTSPSAAADSTSPSSSERAGTRSGSASRDSMSPSPSSMQSGKSGPSTPSGG